MAWENRGDGRYYYRKIWRDGTCRTEYVGNDFVAYNVAGRDKQARACAGAERDRLIGLAKQAAESDRLLSDFRKQVMAAVGDHLASIGYHQHKRQWRKRRGMAESKQLPEVFTDDFSVLTASVLRAQLSGTGSSTKTQEMMLFDIAKCRADLGWASAPAHEKLLIEHIALSYLQLCLVEQHYAQNVFGPKYDQPTAEHFERRLTMAQNRYLRSIESLARVRKLAINIQVNIADKQVISR